MDLLRKLYTSRCSPPGLGEEGRFHFVIKAEEVMTPVHPFVIRAKTKMYLGKGEGGSGRMIQVPVGVGKGTVEQFVKFLYLEQLDKDVVIKEERQLLRLAVLKELKLKREYQEKLVEIIDAFKVEGQDTKRDVEVDNAQGSDGQYQSGNQDVPVQEDGNMGEVADQGNGGFRNGDDDDHDDGDVTFVCVIKGELKREQRHSPAPSSALASTPRGSTQTREEVLASVKIELKPPRHLNDPEPNFQAQEGNETNDPQEECPILNIGSQEHADMDRVHQLRHGERKSKRNIPSRPRPRRVSRLKCKRCGKIFCSIIAVKGHIKGFHNESPSGTLHSSNPRRRSQRKSRLNENLTGDVEYSNKEDVDSPDISTITMDQKGKRKKRNENENPCPSLSNLPSTSGRVVRLKCFFCSEIFQNHGLFEVHTRNHTKERPYRCQKCDQSFTGRQGLSRHEVSSHTNLRCETCKKTFPTKDSLLIHLRGSHKTYGCPQCEQIFNSKEQMDVHVARVHQGKTYSCTMCKKLYTTKRNMQDHFNSAHKKLTFPCPHCDSSYSWPANLTTHMKRHEGNLLL